MSTATRARAARCLGVLVSSLAGATAALASQGPGVSQGSAEPITQAAAAALALFPLVAVGVFALARAVGER